MFSIWRGAGGGGGVVLTAKGVEGLDVLAKFSGVFLMCRDWTMIVYDLTNALYGEQKSTIEWLHM